MSFRDSALVAILLLAISASLYGIHFALFRDAHHILLYLIGDLAFLPLQVLIITVLVDRILSTRERRARLHKLNMVIGTFFSDTGTPLLRVLRPIAANAEKICIHARIGPDWGTDRIRQSIAALDQIKPRVALTPAALTDLRDTLCTHRGFLISLLENPVLMEHEAFTDLLWAVFHLQEELAARQALDALPEPDLRHLTVDVERAYAHLLREWLTYMLHLRTDYPYLFSFAARMNPLSSNPSPEVAE